jgi:RNA polymerase sigma-70 factor (family 1)
MNSNLITDEQLWEAIALSDDKRAFSALYDRYWKKIYKSANYYLHDSTISKQVLSDLFVSLWEKRKNLQIENFNNYSYVAIRYHVFSYLRSIKISPIEFIDSYDDVIDIVVSNRAEDKFKHDDFEHLLSNHLNILPKRCREIFWMSRIDQLNNDEIALKLGISKRTVENQITHALKHLRLSYGKLAESLLLIIFLLYNI